MNRNAAVSLIVAGIVVFVLAFAFLLIRERYLSARLAKYEGPRDSAAIPEGEYSRYRPILSVNATDAPQLAMIGYKINVDATTFGQRIRATYDTQEENPTNFIDVTQEFYTNERGEVVYLSGRFVPLGHDSTSDSFDKLFREAYRFAARPIYNNPDEQYAAMLTWLEDHWDKGGEAEFGGVYYRLEFDGGTRRLYMRMANQEIIPAIPGRPLNFNENNAPRHY